MSSIMLSLRTCDDLKKDLMSVLYHGEASWSPEDFDFGEKSVELPPLFLEPSHQPQMFPTSCYSRQQDLQPHPPVIPWDETQPLDHLDQYQCSYDSYYGHHTLPPFGPLYSSPTPVASTNVPASTPSLYQQTDATARAHAVQARESNLSQLQVENSPYVSSMHSTDMQSTAGGAERYHSKSLRRRTHTSYYMIWPVLS